MTRWHSLMACLGLLALTLAIGGPLLSQTQRLLEAQSAPHPTHHQTAHHHHATTAAHANAHSHGHATAANGHDDHLAACGYCPLFLHMPGMLVQDAVTLARPAVSPAPLGAGIYRPHTGQRYRLYHGRAPPLRSLV
ncbi:MULTISPECIES: DUF2946 family protein [Halomonadaceae]|uniref:DUF2946 family protein n=1 Tax=Billgrantia aerodenitrificans TaxID=2733483 RepID=A0ABS9ARP5_9GAMM|nr:DUF2946 family protein [Halomonas aerodenitrificans]MCE8036758.1 DUF2946 family protein [Halomonas sp. MCCC 1A11062]